MKKKGILILTPFYSPNLGGVETSLDDLSVALTKRDYNVFVQTYSPITTPDASWKSYEKDTNVEITRYKWFGKNLFHKLEKFPFFDFLYLTPYLLLRSLIWMIKNNKKVDIIHAQGFNAAFIGLILKKIFNKKLIVSTHAVYEINPNSSTAKYTKSILERADKVLCLSQASYNELVSLGIKSKKLSLFKYWINLERFKKMSKKELRKKLNISDKFTVLFVGRLIEKKGVRVLAEVARQIPEINFVFVGLGPEENFIKQQAKLYKNIKFIGSVENKKLQEYYNVADIFCIPSQYEEGFGRVVMEAVACGLPVVGSNKGGIPEALDDSVSLLIEPNVNNLKNNLLKLYKNKELYDKLSLNCRKYAEKNFSDKNLNFITKYY
jgi:glycosyltransferase involved in cell wall biosynthesis